VISGLLAAVAGPILVGRLGAADPTLLNVQAFYQLLATGLIIRVAMLIDRATRGRE
jgi:ribose transport system permease protein